MSDGCRRVTFSLPFLYGIEHRSAWPEIEGDEVAQSVRGAGNIGIASGFNQCLVADGDIMWVGMWRVLAYKAVGKHMGNVLYVNHSKCGPYEAILCHGLALPYLMLSLSLRCPAPRRCRRPWMASFSPRRVSAFPVRWCGCGRRSGTG